jgi:hypothetical protein
MSDNVRRRFARIGARVALSGLLAGLGVAVASSPAAAAAAVACPSAVTWTDVIRFRHMNRYVGYETITQSVTPVFLVSDARFLDNGLDSPVAYTITSSVSQTFAVTASVGINIDVTSYLKTSVSTTIQYSRTTSIGVSITATVPAHSQVYADYGVDGYYVTYTIQKWWGETYNRQPPVPGANQCFLKGTYPQATNAPTNSEGWKLRAG